MKYLFFEINVLIFHLFPRAGRAKTRLLHAFILKQGLQMIQILMLLLLL